MKKFTADFETATWLPNETYVWAWAICEIGNPDNIIIDNNIESFMKFFKKNTLTLKKGEDINLKDFLQNCPIPHH